MITAEVLTQWNEAETGSGFVAMMPQVGITHLGLQRVTDVTGQSTQDLGPGTPYIVRIQATNETMKDIEKDTECLVVWRSDKDDEKKDKPSPPGHINQIKTFCTDHGMNAAEVDAVVDVGENRRDRIGKDLKKAMRKGRGDEQPEYQETP